MSARAWTVRTSGAAGVGPAPRIARNEVVVVHGHLVVGGSHTYTVPAQHRNAEHVTFIDSPEVAGRFPATSESRKEASRGYRIGEQGRDMCGRLANDLPPAQLARIFGALNALPNRAPSWNVAPSQDALVVRRNPETGERSLDPLRWGLLPYWTREGSKAPKPINARAETVATSGMFKAAVVKRRCLVPATAWYEWLATPAGKMPYAFGRRDGTPLALAGLWEGWRGSDGEVTRTFAVITTEANAVARQVHPRMPVVLEAADWPLWLGEAAGDPTALLRPAGDAVIRGWRVSTRVNSVRNDGPDLLVPQAEPELAQDGGPNPA